MKGITLMCLGVVAFGLLFVGSRAEGETTTPSVPDVSPTNSPGGDSKGQGPSPAQPKEEDARDPLPKCWECGNKDETCLPEKAKWTQLENCKSCKKTVTEGGIINRGCSDVGVKKNKCDKDSNGTNTCLCPKSLCNVSLMPSPYGPYGLLTFLAALSLSTLFKF